MRETEDTGKKINKVFSFDIEEFLLLPEESV